MKNSIRKRLIITTSIMVGLALLISGLVVFGLLRGELTNQSIRSDHEKLRLLVWQIENQMENVRTLARHIIVDDHVQAYASTSEIRTVRTNYELGEKMREYLVFLDYAQSIALIFSDGCGFWSQTPFDPQAFDIYLFEDWYTSIQDQIGGVFSALHTVQTNQSHITEMISYITPIQSSTTYQVEYGQMVLNIDRKYFSRILEGAADSFEGISLFDQRGQIISSVGRTADLIGKFEWDETTILRDHYVVSEQIESGWHVVAISPLKTSLIYQSVFGLYYLLFALGSLLLILLGTIPFQMSLTKPLQKLTDAMRRVSEGEIDTVAQVNSRDEIGLLSDVFNAMLCDIRNYIDETIRLEKEQNNLKFELMLAQINPHFIYNTLDTVIYIANEHQEQDIVDMVRSFIRVLRDNVRLGDEGQWSTFEKEIEMIKHYIELMLYRFPAPIEVAWEIKPEALRKWIPYAILQPIVENALYHGLWHKEGLRKLVIRGYLECDWLVIEIEDNGVGMEEAIVDRLMHPIRSHDGVHRIGLYNVKSRLEILYPNRYVMRVTSAPMRGTCFILKLKNNSCLE